MGLARLSAEEDEGGPPPAPVGVDGDCANELTDWCIEVGGR